VQFLGGALGPPLGVRTAEPYPEATVQLEDQDAVLFYSDGLIERRGRRIDEGLQLARDALHQLPDRGSLDEFCRRLIDTIYPGTGGDDDTCVLVIRRAAG
jgi:serine phosphatase RsbU (regulator of sigma subunit)